MVYLKYAQCLWSVLSTFCYNYGSENARNRQISFRRIVAVLHFFIRVVFLAELEILEITKRKKNVTESRLGAKFKIELIIFAALGAGRYTVPTARPQSARRLFEAFYRLQESRVWLQLIIRS